MPATYQKRVVKQSDAPEGWTFRHEFCNKTGIKKEQVLAWVGQRLVRTKKRRGYLIYNLEDLDVCYQRAKAFKAPAGFVEFDKAVKALKIRGIELHHLLRNHAEIQRIKHPTFDLIYVHTASALYWNNLDRDSKKTKRRAQDSASRNREKQRLAKAKQSPDIVIDWKAWEKEKIKKAEEQEKALKAKITQPPHQATPAKLCRHYRAQWKRDRKRAQQPSVPSL